MASKVLGLFKTSLANHFLRSRPWKNSTTFIDLWSTSSVAAASDVARQMNGELSTFHSNHFEIEVKGEGTYVMTHEDNEMKAVFMGDDVLEEVAESGYDFADDLNDKYGPKETFPDRKAELSATIERLRRRRNRSPKLENKLQMSESMLEAIKRKEKASSSSSGGGGK